MADQPQPEAAGDVTTAQAVMAMHLPYIDAEGRPRCASASHPWSKLGPPYPCVRARGAQRVIDAHERAKAHQASPRSMSMVTS